MTDDQTARDAAASYLARMTPAESAALLAEIHRPAVTAEPTPTAPPTAAGYEDFYPTTTNH